MKNTGLTWIENIRSTRKLQTMGPWKWIPCTTDVFKILFFLSQVTFLFGQSVGFRWDAPLSITTTTSSVVNDIVLVKYVCMWYVVFFDYLILHSLFTHRKPIPRESAFIPLFLLLFCRGLKSPEKKNDFCGFFSSHFQVLARLKQTFPAAQITLEHRARGGCDLECLGAWSQSIQGYLVGGFNFFYFHPYLGKWSNLTSIFFRWVETTN